MNSSSLICPFTQNFAVFLIHAGIDELEANV